MSIMKTGVLALVSIFFFGNSKVSASAFVNVNHQWGKGATVPVCFENPAPGNLAGRQMVEYVVKNSWEKVANINFEFKTSACGTTSQGIMIKITDTEKGDCYGRPTRDIGRPVTCTHWESEKAVSAKMLLNFTFDKFKGAMSPVAIDTALRRKQINRMIFHYTIHEFGHAIGFLHEDDRVDGKDIAGAQMCSDDDGEYTKGTPVWYYDIHSVMHYLCNSAGNWPNGPPVTLSCGDMATARWMYGDRNTQIGSACLAANAKTTKIPTNLSAGYSVPPGGYDIGPGADTYQAVTNPTYSSLRSYNLDESHLMPNGGTYPPRIEPNVTMAISLESKVVSGKTTQGYRLSFTLNDPKEPKRVNATEAWVQQLTLLTMAGPITIYRDINNPEKNKPLWAYNSLANYPSPRLPDRSALLDLSFPMGSARINQSNRTWSTWVQKGQHPFRNDQDEYQFLFQPPLPGVTVQSANQDGLYLADMNFYAVSATMTYWDGAWYESMGIKGAVPRHPEIVQYFFNKDELLSKTKRISNPRSPTQYLQVGVTEVTKADYFFATSRRTPYAPATLDFSSAGLPATGITWYDAIIYCNLRSELEGLEKVYSYSYPSYAQGPSEFAGRCVSMFSLSADLKKNGYRLPTEAEWKDFYSRPASQEYYWPIQENAQDYAWFGNGLTAPMPARGKRPNSRGLYDLAGNAAEYIWGNESGSMVLAKGGSVTATMADLGKSSRQYLAKYDPNPLVSLRVVRTVRYPFSGMVLSLLFD